MLKSIKAFLLLLFLLSILFISVMFWGIKIDSFSFANINVSQFYIKLDKKLIVSIEKLELLSKKSKVENSLDNIKKDIDLFPKVLKIFQQIDIKNLTIDGNEFNIFLKDDILYLDNKYINLSANLDISSRQNTLDLYSLYFKDYEVLLMGKIKLDYFKEEIKYYGNIHYKDMILASNIDATKDKIKFFTRSSYFENIHFLKEFLPDLPKEAKEWMYDNVTGEFKVDWFYGEFDLEKNLLLEESLQGKAHIKDAQIKYHKDLETIKTSSVDVVYKKGNLDFYLQNPIYKGKSLENSFVSLKNLIDEDNGLVEVNIFAKTKLDNDILNILKAYNIKLPVLQKSGNTNASLKLSIPYASDKSLKTYGKFDVQDAIINIEGFEFFSKSANVTLDDTKVIIENADFKYQNMIYAKANLTINTDSLLSNGEVNISRIFVEDSNKEEILDLRNKKSTIKMDFNDGLKISLDALDTDIFYDENLKIEIKDLEKIYKYSKLLQDNSIKDGYLNLDIKDENNILFDGFVKGLDFPIYKDKNQVKEIFVNGKIESDKVEIKSLNEEIKISINEKIDIRLKNLLVKVPENSDASLSSKDINLILENSKLNLDDDIYNLKYAKVEVKKDIVNFFANVKDINLPLKRFGKEINDLKVNGSIKNGVTTLNSVDGGISLTLKNKDLNLKLDSYEIFYDFKDDNSSLNLEYENIKVEAKNSNLILDRQYNLLSDFLEINFTKDNKFIYLKHKNSEATIKENEDKTIDIFAYKLGDEFINALASKEIMKDGYLNFYASGTFDEIKGKITIKDSSISNLTILSNILAFIEATPGVFAGAINPFFAVSSLVGVKNIGTYKLSDGILEFTYDDNNKFLELNNLNTIGNGIDFEGSAKIDLNKFTIDSKLNLIFLKDYSNVVASIPVINYIFLGDDKRVETQIDIKGSLEDPKIKTNLVKDGANASLNIMKRLFTFPLHYLGIE